MNSSKGLQLLLFLFSVNELISSEIVFLLLSADESIRIEAMSYQLMG